MDEYRTPRRSPAGEQFIGMFSSPSTPSSSPTEPSFVAGDELHEDDFLFDAAAPQPDGPRSPGRGAPPGHLGLLATLALHEGDRRLLVRGGHGGGVAAATAAVSAGTLLRRKATIAAAAASASASVASGSGGALSPAQSPSPTSSARAIPATAKPKNTGPAPAFHQSAPVKVPVRPPRKPDMGRWDEFDDDDDDFRSGDAAMLPPHEMVARASAGGAGPAAPFSMLEGAGRTLKGRSSRPLAVSALSWLGGDLRPSCMLLALLPALFPSLPAHARHALSAAARRLSAREAALDGEVAEYQSTYAMKLACEKTKDRVAETAAEEMCKMARAARRADKLRRGDGRGPHAP